jgi:hypothetical protein
MFYNLAFASCSFPVNFLSTSAVNIAVYVKHTDLLFLTRQYSIPGIFLSISTTLIVTVMISIYLIHTRRSLSGVLPSRNLQLYTGIVAILVEAALPLSVFGLLLAATLLYPEKQSMHGVEVRKVLASIFSMLFYSFVVSPQWVSRLLFA